MTILVTGGAGFIASHTNIELLNAGYDVIVMDNLCNSSKESVARVEQITGKKVKFYEADMRNVEDLEKIFSENVIDVIIYILAVIGTATLIYPETRALMVKMIQELLNYFNLFI